MENIVNVEGTELDVREYNGQMVVTFDDIDLVHKRPSGTARKAFNRNKKRFINGVDYIVLEKENSNVHRVDITDCRQNAFGQHSRSVFLVLGSKSVYLINNKHFWVPLFPFLAIIFASFFRFMQANVSPTFISIRAFPIICV